MGLPPAGLSAIFPITKTTAKKPCFSKSGDAVPIPNAKTRHFQEINYKSNVKITTTTLLKCNITPEVIS